MEKECQLLEDEFGLKKSLMRPLLKKGRLTVAEDCSYISIKIDEKTYKNALSKYTEILNKYFSKEWKIFVLAKIKIPNRVVGIFNIFFHNSKKDVINEMKVFSPSYLLKKDSLTLLINIESDKVTISKVSIPKDVRRFVYNSYRYTIANEINR